MKKRVIVTGGSGKAGRWIVKDLLENGYEVLNLDVKPSPDCRTIITDLTDSGQVHNAMSIYNGRDHDPIEAIIHFAAIPHPFDHPNDVVFRNNVMSTYNILEAAANMGIQKVVLASSESSYGLVFAHELFNPQYLPMDEEHPQLPEDSYGLSKVINEKTAEAFNRRTGMQVVSFRLGNILAPEDYPGLIENFKDPEQRKVILWSYIDVRDVANACRLAIEKSGLGAEAIILAADDTSSNLSSQQLIADFFPEVGDIRLPSEGRPSLLSNQKLKRLLGWEQQYTWEQYQS